MERALKKFKYIAKIDPKRILDNLGEFYKLPRELTQMIIVPYIPTQTLKELCDSTPALQTYLCFRPPNSASLDVTTSGENVFSFRLRTLWAKYESEKYELKDVLKIGKNKYALLMAYEMYLLCTNKFYTERYAKHISRNDQFAVVLFAMNENDEVILTFGDEKLYMVTDVHGFKRVFDKTRLNMIRTDRHRTIKYFYDLFDAGYSHAEDKLVTTLNAELIERGGGGGGGYRGGGSGHPSGTYGGHPSGTYSGRPSGTHGGHPSGHPSGTYSGRGRAINNGRHGYLYGGRGGWYFPWWYYGGYWYPWWFMYSAGIMTMEQRNQYAQQYGEPPAGGGWGNGVPPPLQVEGGSGDQVIAKIGPGHSNVPQK